MDKHIDYNYFKILDQDGEVCGVGAAEKGSPNEVFIINEIMNFNYTLVKITKEEYDDYDDGIEIKNF